jgi:tetratricopeptide (TPR) repeat protein
MISCIRSLSALCIGLVVLVGPGWAENEGLDDLDKATQLKVAAESMDDLAQVIEHLETALEKGLDQENTEFAEHLLVASLLQRGTLFAQAIFNVPMQDAQRGLRSMQLRQFALNDLQRAVQLDPQQWDAYLLIGKLQVLPLGDANAARRALSQVVEADDATPEQKAEALALRSAVQRDENAQAADLDRAVELQPEKPEYVRLRAQHRYEHEKLDEALADIDRALALEPDHAASQEVRGMILLGLERYDEALASFNRASELAPEAALPYQHRGQLYLKKGDPEKAVEQLTKALELAPESVGALLVRAGVYYELKQTNRALKDVEAAIRVQPQLVQPHLMRAEILAASDRMDEAIAHLERLVQVAPTQLQLLGQLGTFYILDSQPRKAIEVLSRVLEQEPENYRALRFRADSYLNIGQHAEAIADFERAHALNDDDESLLNNFAWVLATSPDDDLRDGERAVQLATQAAEASDYEAPHVLSTLAAAYAETGDFETAKKWSQKAVELAQKHVEAATTDEERKQLEIELSLDQLKKELESYREGRPVRERQTVEEKEQPEPKDHALTPSPTPAPARSADF